MTPHKQLFRHNPAEGVWGDCDRTTIACLLDLRPEDVPHWGAGCAGVGPVPDEYLTIRRAWLKERGMFLVSVPLQAEDISAVMAWAAVNHPGINYLVGGTSKSGVNHVVICRDHAVVHDTHPDNVGLVGPSDDGYWWVNFLGRIT